ncbi:glycoside hydrolase family 13 protein [Hoyosella altamirensis]|uniref:Alpha-glucosidase n=1 Tax=Hoyosella altamirensis TaxID=616997 RepID=A0A839RQ40_9ACTN|nr:glycoside hydrolase family 13 protein [Hoyosella altamirensis]MBB3038517.1 alpha-glucosidase [Hoyosella altamirensis]
MTATRIACDSDATTTSDSSGPLLAVHPADSPDDAARWWRSSVIYQIYPRSFRDLDGDGNGDLAGITAELGQLAEMDIDAVWLSPFYPSPQRDGGYDVSNYCDVAPMYGSLATFDHLVERATALGIRVIIDLVPNHCSDEHPLFQKALAAGPGSRERDMFIFRDGKGPEGAEPPNNWQSHFGGSAWTRVVEVDDSPGQWYLHLFDSSQPDFNWDNAAVHGEFERILRFWLDRGVAGFRVDVAHSLVKKQDLPDWHGRPDGVGTDDHPGHLAPMFGQPALHDIYRRWRQILAEYGDDRVLCAEASIDPLPRLSDWVRPDEMHQTFNFAFLNCPWDATRFRTVIEDSLRAFDAVGAPTTWVLSNHDVQRHVTRFGITERPDRPGDGLGPDDPQPDLARGQTLARAASLLMLGLPGGVYLYQGEELGLPDHTLMPHSCRQDPTYARTDGQRLGRDGSRVPLPWESRAAAAGFSESGAAWLPQPAGWESFARDVQRNDPESVLAMYTEALRLRRNYGLGHGSLEWLPEYLDTACLAFANGDVLVMVNTGDTDVCLPTPNVLLSSASDSVRHGSLRPGHTVWVKRT